MPYIPLSVKIRGVLPSLQHAGRLKNPLDPWAKQIRVYSKKRLKTDEDHLAMMEAEFKGGLYCYEDDMTKMADGKFPYWPADNIHACIKTQAKERKLGKVVDAAVVIVPPGGKEAKSIG